MPKYYKTLYHTRIKKVYVPVKIPVNKSKKYNKRWQPPAEDLDDEYDDEEEETSDEWWTPKKMWFKIILIIVFVNIVLLKKALNK